MTETRYHDRKKKYYEAHKEEINARTNEWRRKNKEKTKEIRTRNSQTFREKMDAEYPGGYAAYNREQVRKSRAKKKAEAEAKAQAALSEPNNAQPTQ